MIIIIPAEVKTALSILNLNGFEAFIVGGCVRDSLLCSVPNDWDITTSAKPDEITKCFNNYKTINTGLKHGTVTVIINRMQIEITTYRIDGEYSDNRRPDAVFYTSDISLDLKRRDFTINALAYNEKGIVDLFGGIEDIKNKVIKCVGDPDERFNEDGLRILRALRFASVLNFKINSNTSKSIHKNKELLKNISGERIAVEFNKLLLGTDFLSILREYRDVIEIFIPKIQGYDNREWEDILSSMNHAEDLILRLSILLHKINTEKALRDLKYDGVTIKKVKSMVGLKNEEIFPDKVKIKKQLNCIGYEDFIFLLKFKKALYKSHEDRYKQEICKIENSEEIINEIVLNNECYNLKMLGINGKDLKKEGFSKGILIGSILNDILELVIEGKLQNNREELINHVRKYKIRVDTEKN